MPVVGSKAALMAARKAAQRPEIHIQSSSLLLRAKMRVAIARCAMLQTPARRLRRVLGAAERERLARQRGPFEIQKEQSLIRSQEPRTGTGTV